MCLLVIITISGGSTVIIVSSSAILPLFFAINCLPSVNLALLSRNVIGANVSAGESEKFSSFGKYSGA
jgi:hypothetical protein